MSAHQLRRKRSGEVYCTCGGEIAHDACDRCGGDGNVEYDDAPDTWGEDSPSEANHLVECPDCDGHGRVSYCARARGAVQAHAEGSGR